MWVYVCNDPNSSEKKELIYFLYWLSLDINPTYISYFAYWNFFKGSQVDAFSPKPIVCFYLEFKLSYLKNLKLFTIRVEKLCEPIVLWRKGDGVLSLFISIFLGNRSLSDARWFYCKKTENWKGNLYLIENWLIWNEYAVLQIITIICVTHVQKNFQIQVSIKQLLTKYQIFLILPKNLTFSQKS